MMIDLSPIAKQFLLAAAIVLAAVPAQAGKVEFVKQHTYRAGDMDSKVSCRAIALVEVKRALLEQLGTYLASETEVRNYKMTRDQVTVLTAGIVSAEILDEKWDGREFTLKAKLVVDPQEVAERVKAMSRDRERTAELEEAKRKRDQALKEVERLRKDMGLAHQDIQGQMDLQADYSRAVQDLGSDDWYSGFRFQMKDGSSFIWTNYEEYGDSYCTRLDAGRICVQMRDVAMIRKGAYPENAEVISGKIEDEHSRSRAERDWQARQRENERAQRSFECRQMLDYLQQLRPESDAYKTQYDQYRRECSAPKSVSAPAQGKSGASKTPAKKERKRADMDRIIENANDGSVF